VLVNNERVQIQRLSVPAGFRETLQSVPNDQIAIQITPGDLEVVINGQKTTGRIEPGTTFYVPKNAPHQFSTSAKRPMTSSS
jgi:quercetin dioxygenase-like cupin family protein